MSNDENHNKFATHANRSLEFLLKYKFQGKQLEQIRDEAYSHLCDNYKLFLDKGHSEKDSVNKAYSVVIDFIRTTHHLINREIARSSLTKEAVISSDGDEKHLYSDPWSS